MANTSSAGAEGPKSVNKEKGKEEATSAVGRVAKEFVKCYYSVLNEHASFLYQFYGNGSSIVVSESQDSGAPITVNANDDEGIKKLLNALFADVTVNVETYFPQQSIDGSVLLLVSGKMMRKGFEEERLFTQAFLLARQVQGYYVRTDTLQVHNRTSFSESPGSREQPFTQEPMLQAAAPVTPRSVLPQDNQPTADSGGVTVESALTEQCQKPTTVLGPDISNTVNPPPQEVGKSNLVGPSAASKPPSPSLVGQKPQAIPNSVGDTSVHVANSSKPVNTSGLLMADDGNQKSLGMEEKSNIDANSGAKKDSVEKKKMELDDANGTDDATLPMKAPGANGIVVTPKLSENGLEDREVEPPSQVVAPIEKPFHVGSEPSQNNVAAPESAATGMVTRKSYAQAVLSSASRPPATQTVRAKENKPVLAQVTQSQPVSIPTLQSGATAVVAPTPPSQAGGGNFDDPA